MHVLVSAQTSDVDQDAEGFKGVSVLGFVGHSDA